MNRVQVLQSLIEAIHGTTYLEIGVEFGDSFIPIRTRRKIAVDPAFPDLQRLKAMGSASARDLRFFQTTSDVFFKKHSLILQQSPIDVAFIDGLHTYAQSLRDVLNCIRWLSPRGVIAMHDCSPSNPTMAHPANSIEHAASLNLPNWTGEWCGDVWKTIVHLRSTRPDLHVTVLDCDYGIGLIRKGHPEDLVDYEEPDIGLMQYPHLAAGRVHLLNLKPPAYLHVYVEQLTQGNA
jgi:hypothetical protein